MNLNYNLASLKNARNKQKLKTSTNFYEFLQTKRLSNPRIDIIDYYSRLMKKFSLQRNLPSNFKCFDRQRQSRDLRVSTNLFMK